MAIVGTAAFGPHSRWGNAVGFFMAVIGSIIVLALYRFTIGRSAPVSR
jgi:uncharacterized membrane protein YeaQ/YmgE (transglycosylase-associated protein family)